MRTDSEPPPDSEFPTVQMLASGLTRFSSWASRQPTRLKRTVAWMVGVAAVAFLWPLLLLGLFFRGLRLLFVLGGPGFRYFMLGSAISIAGIAMLESAVPTAGQLESPWDLGSHMLKAAGFLDGDGTLLGVLADIIIAVGLVVAIWSFSLWQASESDDDSPERGEPRSGNL